MSFHVDLQKADFGQNSLIAQTIQRAAGQRDLVPFNIERGCRMGRSKIGISRGFVKGQDTVCITCGDRQKEDVGKLVQRECRGRAASGCLHRFKGVHVGAVLKCACNLQGDQTDVCAYIDKTAVGLRSQLLEKWNDGIRVVGSRSYVEGVSVADVPKERDTGSQASPEVGPTARCETTHNGKQFAWGPSGLASANTEQFEPEIVMAFAGCKLLKMPLMI